ncbi:MAG: cation-translocating P-type ATPase [Bacilli bacterium]|nr:cation-translocating P-type ATPase [Bacilli bacterium]
MFSFNSIKAKFNTDRSSYEGLTEKEAKQRLEKYGFNTLKEKAKISKIKIIADQFKDILTIILLISTVISLIMGDTVEAITIIIIVFINATLGFIQEYRTEKSMEALKKLSAPHARVVRDGKITNIPASNIVPDDLIILEAGDKIPADGKVIEVASFYVDESLLTGESISVEKNISSCPNVYMGTIVMQGRAKVIVKSTGMNTEMGKIANMLQGITEEATPLQKRLEELGKFIAYLCLGICIFITLIGIIRGEPIFDMLLVGISLAVAAIPESLTATITICLALGVQRMLKRNALIRKLSAVETLGCSSVVCSDKTGTLTENKMTVTKMYTYNNLINVTGNGFNPSGKFLNNNIQINPLDIESIKLSLEISGVCNNSELSKKDISNIKKKGIASKIYNLPSISELWTIEGDPTEGALLVVAHKAGLNNNVLSKKYRRIDEIPFDSNRKCMSVICSDTKGSKLMFTKGAPDIVINKCTKMYTDRGIIELTSNIKRDIIKINENLASEALRVLCVAYKELSSSSSKEEDLVFVGLIGMIDPPRQEAFIAIKKCILAGIKPVMITGDHKITAIAIAKQLGIYKDGDKVLTGIELDKIDEKQLQKLVKDVSVYSRVSPRHKLMIIKAFKKNNHIVAMTGDGVNDAPAIKEADIGVAMGISGTDVTKEASSMILLDDNFATLIAAIEEGRIIYKNIRKFIRYLLSCNIGEVLTMFVGILLGMPLPLIPIQILSVNLLTDGLPAIALGIDPSIENEMKNKPRKSKEGIFSQGLLWLIVFRGIVIGFTTLLVFGSFLKATGNLDIARTGAYLTLVLTQLIHVFECKSEKLSLFQIPIFNNKPLILAVLCSLLVVISTIYIPFLQTIFKTAPLTINQVGIILLLSLATPIMSTIMRKS